MSKKVLGTTKKSGYGAKKPLIIEIIRLGEMCFYLLTAIAFGLVRSWWE